MDIQVIETIEDSCAEWGISFNGPNPPHEDYFKMSDGDTAFRLRDRLLAEFSPVS